MEGIKRLFRDTCQHGSGFRVSSATWTQCCSEVSVHSRTHSCLLLSSFRVRRRRNVTAEAQAQGYAQGSAHGCHFVGERGRVFSIPKGIAKDASGDDGINKYSARVAGFPVDGQIKGMREIPRASRGLRRVCEKGTGAWDGLRDKTRNRSL